MIWKKSSSIILTINILGILLYSILRYFIKEQTTTQWKYFLMVILFTLTTNFIYSYANYYRVNGRLKQFKAEKKIKRRTRDLLFSKSISIASWIVLIILVCWPSLQKVQGLIQKDNAISPIVIEKKTTINVPFNFKYTEIKDIADRYGFQRGVILELRDREAELLLFHSSIDTEDELIAKRMKVNDQNEVIFEEEAYLSKELVGYSLDIIYGNASSMDYLLGYRSIINSTEKKLYSDLIVIDKKFPTMNITLLQSYVANYDVAMGIIPQGTIPTIIDFSVNIIGDYLVFQDVDSYWKVQNVKTKEIYESDENNSMLDEVQPNYMVKGDYIYILRYTKDNSILAFNRTSKDFSVLAPKSKE